MFRGRLCSLIIVILCAMTSVQGRRGNIERKQCSSGQDCGTQQYRCTEGLIAIQNTPIKFGTRGSPGSVPSVSFEGCAITQMELASIMRSTKVPVILRDGPWTEWPIYKTWTWEYLRQHAPTEFKNTFEGPKGSPVIKLEAGNTGLFSGMEDRRSTEELTRSALGIQQRIQTVKSADVFDSLLGIKPLPQGKIVRLTGHPTYVIPKLQEDLIAATASEQASGKWHPYFTWKLPVANSSKTDTIRTNIAVLIGSAGLISHSHHDAFSNFLLMVNGTKRFTFSPPSEALKYGMYSGSHPLSILYRQSQHGAVPDGAQVIDTKVHTGEILYTPVGWYHYVETLDHPAVGLAITKNSAAHDAMKEQTQTVGTVGVMWPADQGKPKTMSGWIAVMFVMIPKYVKRIGALCVPEISLDYILKHIFSEKGRMPYTPYLRNAGFAASLKSLNCSQMRRPTQTIREGMEESLNLHERNFRALAMEECIRNFLEIFDIMMIYLGGPLLVQQKKFSLPREPFSRNQATVAAALSVLDKCHGNAGG